jgi:integrase
MPSPRHAHVQFTAPAFDLLELERNRFRSAILAERTISSYQRDQRTFGAWCAAAEREPLPATPETVELYITDLIYRGRTISTACRHVCGIQYAHRTLGYANPCTPTVREILTGARRILCPQPKQKTALLLDQLRRIVEAIGRRTAIQARNSALLLFGFATALRRSNLSAMRLEDVSVTDQRIVAFIRHEKQDRTGEGRTVTIPAGRHNVLCPVRALSHWLKWRGTGPGALFQGVQHGKPTGRGILGSRIAQIVQQAVGQIGLDPRFYGGHSLRAGFVTEAILKGVNDLAIMKHTGHRSLETLRKYFRPVYDFRTNPCRQIGF